MNEIIKTRNSTSFTNAVRIALLIATYQLPIMAYAGTGTIDTTQKTIDIKTLYTYQETTNKLTGSDNPNWQKVFNEASKRLWNATNGQLRIGTVKAYLRAVNKKDDADIWIAKGSGGAYATGLAKMGSAGDHMQFYADTHRDLGTYKGDFSIVHEMGHYVFGLYDQYIGAWVPFAKKDNWTDADLRDAYKKNANIYSVTATDTNASIMDGGGGVSPQNQRTEFDTAGNINKGVKSGNRWYMNKHWIKFKESTWETLAKFKWNGVNVFTTIPTGDSDTTMPAGFTDIDFVVVPSLSRLVLTIDRSGSMDSENKMELAKLGARTFVSLTDEEHSYKLFEGTSDEETITIDADWLGVVDFDSSVTTTYPLTAITATTQSEARSAIDSLYDRGSTAIGSGIQQSLSLITGAGDQTSGETIILLSDGYNNSGIDPMDAAAAAKAREAKIYTIALGDNADTALLSSIATFTGGKFYQATDGLALAVIYPQIYSDLKGGSLVEATSSLLNENEQASHSVLVDALTEEATFFITSPDEGWGFSITDPDGHQYTGSDAQAGVTYEAVGNTLKYRVSVPKQGSWNLAVTAPTGSSGNTHQYNVLTSSSSQTVMLATATDNASYVFPQPILVSANLVADDPVANAEVTATVSGPDGILGTIKLYDDGLSEHGDETANDGRYSTYYRNFTANGVYSFDITANNEKGVQGIGVPENITGTPSAPQPIPKFTRTSSIAAEVIGVPTLIKDWLRVDALKINRIKTTDTANIKLALTLNNQTFDADQLAGSKPLDDLILSIGNRFSIVNSSDFKKIGKKPGIFKIRSADKLISGTLAANIGGSSRSKLVLNLKKAQVADNFSSPIAVSTNWGEFEHNISLDVTTQQDRKLSYLAKKNYSNTPELYINALLAKIKTQKSQKDSLRVVANFSGGGANFDPANDDFSLELGSFILQVPAGTLIAKKAGKIAKGQINNLKITVDPQKHILTLRGNKQSLSTLISETIPTGLNIGDFSRRTQVVLARKISKTMEKYRY